MGAQRGGEDWDYPFPQASLPPGPALAPHDPYAYQAPPRRSSAVSTLLAVLCIVAIGTGVGWYLLRSNVTAQAPAAAPIVTTSQMPIPTRTGASTVAGRPTRALPVLFRSEQGHFVARFAVRPQVTSSTRVVNLVTVHEHLAVDSFSDSGVATIEIDHALSSGSLDDFVTGAFRGATTTAGLTQDGSPRRTTFRGHHAYSGEVASEAGVRLTLYVVQWSPTRFYLLTAHSGSQFTALLRSFKPMA